MLKPIMRLAGDVFREAITEVKAFPMRWEIFGHHIDKWR